MKKFVVYVREVHIQPILVEADSEQDAISLLKEKGSLSNEVSLLQTPQYHLQYANDLDDEYIAGVEEFASK